MTITASTGLAGLWLLPRLGEFRQQHPHTDVRLVASNTILELGVDVDLAMRYCSRESARHSCRHNKFTADQGDRQQQGS